MNKFFVLLLTLTLASCSIIYRPDVQQGNIVTQEKVAQLRIGMTPQQVRYIMGTPVLSHSFDINRWDYIYTYRKGTDPTEVQNLTLFFTQGYLTKITPTEKYIVQKV